MKWISLISIFVCLETWYHSQSLYTLIHKTIFLWYIISNFSSMWESNHFLVVRKCVVNKLFIISWTLSQMIFLVNVDLVLASYSCYDFECDDYKYV